MVHHRQRLPLGLEAGDHLPRVHAGLDDLERDRPLDRLGLLGHEHDAHAAFADLLQQLVGADDRAGPLGDGRLVVDGGIAVRRLLQESLYLGVGCQQLVELCPLVRIVGTRLVQVTVTLFWSSNSQCSPEDRIRFAGSFDHGRFRPFPTRRA